MTSHPSSHVDAQTTSTSVTMLISPTEAIAGIAGAMCHVYWGHPFDTVKVRLQTQSTAAYRSTFHALRTIPQQEGALALYQGATPALWSAIAEYSVLFTTNDAIRRFTASSAGYSSPEGLPLAWQAISGGLAGMCAGAAMGPPELIKCRLQAANLTRGVQMSPVGCVVAILREEGVRGMFRGTASTMVREVPFNMVLFSAYETVSSCMKRVDPHNTYVGVNGSSILAGGIAGMCAWATVLPIDFVKSTIQTSSSTQTFAAVFLQELKRRGLRGMYAGFGAVSARAFVANAGVFWGYEQTKLLLGNTIPWLG